MLRYSLLTLVIFTLYLLVVSSQELENETLFEEACDLPCWGNLTPGESTTVDVLEQLPNIELYQHATQTRYHTYPSVRFDKDTRITIRWWHDNVQYANQIDIDDFELTSIMIYPQISFSLKDVLNAYGEPSGYSVVSLHEFINDNLSIILSLYYPEIGLIVVFDVYNDSGKATTITLDLETEGNYFSLHQSNSSLTEFVKAISRYPPDDEKTQVQIDRLHNWTDSIEIEVIAVGSTYYVLTTAES